LLRRGHQRSGWQLGRTNNERDPVSADAEWAIEFGKHYDFEIRDFRRDLADPRGSQL
jgi:hypothetical protein